MTAQVLQLRQLDTFADQVRGNIAAETARRGLTQLDLARAIGLANSAVNDRFTWTRGYVLRGKAVPSISEAVAS